MEMTAEVIHVMIIFILLWRIHENSKEIKEIKNELRSTK